MDSSTFFVIAEVAGAWEVRGGYEFLWVNMSYYESLWVNMGYYGLL